MVALTLDGKQTSKEIYDELEQDVALFKKNYGCAPHLVVILVGNNVASEVYVKSKEKIANKIGFKHTVEKLPETATEQEVISVIEQYNKDPKCHGLLVQLPLPAHIDEQRVLTTVDYQKDVDGFHPMNVGNFMLDHPSVLPCTPYGIMTLLDAYQIDFEGKTAVVVGRSNIVGKPMAQLLLQRHATVIMTHSKTKDLESMTKQADILIVAVGKGHFITKNHVKNGAIVVDVGMNRNDSGQLIGDVSSDVKTMASAMTPVPGGVGPMTIAMLLKQTYQLALNRVENIKTKG